MTNNAKYSPDDPDMRLARYLDRDSDSITGSKDPETGDIPEKTPDADIRDAQGKDLFAGIDPLLPILSEYKVRSDYKMNAEAPERVWDHIMNHIEQDLLENSRIPGSQKESARKSTGTQRAREKSFSMWNRPSVLWRIAAILIAVSFLVLYIFVSDPAQPVLLAESEESRKEWTLMDGSTVILRPHSALFSIIESNEEQRYKIRGEGYFDVRHRPDRAFIVQTDEARVRVTGTRFIVRTWDDRTQVYLQDGGIVFSRDDGTGEISLLPGQFSMISDGHILEPEEVATDAYLGWLRGELVLDRRRFEDIAGELSHHFAITIRFSESLRNVELSGTLLLDDPESILNDLAASLEADVEEISEGIYRIIGPGQR